MHSRAVTAHLDERSPSLFRTVLRASVSALLSPFVLFLSLGALLYVTRFAPVSEIELASSDIRHIGGHAYTAPLPRTVTDSLVFSAISDAEGRSNLLLMENGAPFGDPHILHAEIETVGGGRYSHWRDSVRFSTVDGTSPILNGRSYSVRFRPEVNRAVLWAIGALGAFPLAALCYRAVIAMIAVGLSGLVGISAASCAALTLVAAALPPAVRVPVAPPDVYFVDGNAFGYDLASPPIAMVRIPGSAYIESAGAKLAMAGSPLEVVTGGKGVFIERGGAMLFSTADGSDPRSSRTELSAAYSLRPALPLVVLALATGTLILIRRRQLFVRPKRTAL